MLASAGDLMTTLAGVLTDTGQFLSLNVADFQSGQWMLENVNPANIDANVYAAVGQMGANMSMATAAFTVVTKPAVESAGTMVTNLGSIVATLPDVLNAMTQFFDTLVQFLSA
jgi:hypothetical protein